MSSESEKDKARARFLAWAQEVGDPGGNALAGGPPVTHEALKKARERLKDKSVSEKEIFALAAQIDSEKIT